MIVIEIHNDGSGSDAIGNYVASLLLPASSNPSLPPGGWRHTEVKGFDRRRGWAALAHEAINALASQEAITADAQ